MEKGDIVEDGFFEGFPVISAYSRAQAIAEGVLIDLTSRAPDVCRGLKCHIACTVEVWSAIEDAVKCSGGHVDLNGAVHDLLEMSRKNVISMPDESTVIFNVKLGSGQSAQVHTFKGMCHGGDNLEPVVTFSGVFDD